MVEREVKMMTRNTIGLLAAVALYAAASWGGPLPSGAMADHHLQCAWGHTASEAACSDLVDRLAQAAWPSREERLALILSRHVLADWRGEEATYDRGALCADLRAVAADHPDYADPLPKLALFCADGDEYIALLLRAVEIDPDNFDALYSLLHRGWGAGAEAEEKVAAGPLAAHREALYEAARQHAVWEASAAASRNVTVPPGRAWNKLLIAASHIVRAALREGDHAAAEAMRARVRRDTGTDHSAEGLAFACQTIVFMEDFCVEAVEREAASVSEQGLPLPGDVLSAVESVTNHLRRSACAVNSGQDPDSGMLAYLHGCSAEATATPAVRRLRAVLEHHGGAWSSEHHRVLAQGFLGDGDLLEGLRDALRADGENDRARCDLARALASRGRASEAAALGAEPECAKSFAGFTWGDAPPWARAESD